VVGPDTQLGVTSCGLIQTFSQGAKLICYPASHDNFFIRVGSKCIAKLDGEQLPEAIQFDANNLGSLLDIENK